MKEMELPKPKSTLRKFFRNLGTFSKTIETEAWCYDVIKIKTQKNIFKPIHKIEWRSGLKHGLYEKNLKTKSEIEQTKNFSYKN